MISKKVDSKEIRVSLKALRIDTGLTLDQVAKKIGISKYTLYNYEHFKTQPSVSILKKILQFYDVDLDSVRFCEDKKINKEDS